jgi:ATP-dependent DNA helicase RecQ
VTAQESLKQLSDAFALGKPNFHLLEKPRHSWTVEYAAWRLLNAWRQTLGRGLSFSVDHAVLLRQVARWAHGLTLPTIPSGLAALANKAGVRQHGNRFEAIPFVPDWLVQDGDVIDAGEGIDPRPELRRSDTSVPAEHFLYGLGYEHWQSAAQKEAAWLAMTAPKRSTALIVLPTGTGKSLCFQAAARASGGLTVVIVPTIALAMDQCRSAMEALPAMGPRYYGANDRDFPPEEVLSSLKSGTCRLLFVSPEACVSGRLREFMQQHGASGLLTNLVIDEAHLVETWGAAFRVDFQLLSSLRRNWLESPLAEFRTILLSATVSRTSRRLLQQLYSDEPPEGGGWREFSSQRLRPEMAYYFRKFHGDNSEAQRLSAVIECARYLPRPAIFYTTEVKDAEALCKSLREEGFLRTEVFTGDTPSTQRRKLLDQWRKTDEIDLMVATSAFGVGVDKADIRAVVHACFPENLNRYYQEVGRGGRDGAASVCVLLPTEKDRHVATSLLPTMLKPETLQERWDAMWSYRRPPDPEQDHVYKLSPKSQRNALIGERSGRQNAAWNKRLLLQLHRAKKLQLLDVEYEPNIDEPEDDGSEWITVRILDFMPESANLGQSIAEQRKRELDEAAAGLNQIDSYLKADTCMKQVLRRTFGSGTVTVCGGCRFCRRNGIRFGFCPPLAVEPELIITESAPAEPKQDVIGNCPDPYAAQIEFIELVRQSLRVRGILRFYIDAPLNGEFFRRILGILGNSFQAEADVYRLDSLCDQAFLVRPDERLAIFHIDRPSRNGLQLKQGRRVSHFFCGTFYVESNGRHLLLSEGARLFLDWRHWIRAGGTAD